MKYGNVGIFPGSTIHEGGFFNPKSKGNTRIQLHTYSKNHSGVDINNRFYNGYNFKNVTAEQLKLYNFEQSKQHVLKESNDLSNTRKTKSARTNNNDQSPVSHGNNSRYQVGAHISRKSAGDCCETNGCVGRSQPLEGNYALSYAKGIIDNQDSQ